MSPARFGDALTAPFGNWTASPRTFAERTALREHSNLRSYGAQPIGPAIAGCGVVVGSATGS
jgi:hypothetical protein